jgi:replicative DNA helicase
MLRSRAAVDDAREVLTGTDFYQPVHATIYDAICAVADSNVIPEPQTVADHLTDTDQLERLNAVGGAAYLHQLYDLVAIPASAGYYADKIRDAALLRKVIETGARLQQIGQTESDADTALDVVNTARQELDTVATRDAHGTPNDRAVYEAVDDLEQPPGLATPWEYLTNVIAGWKPGCLYLIGARPGVGKSVAGADIILDVARRDQAALMFSLEMSKAELYHRLFAHVGSINMSKLQHRNLKGGDWEQVSKAASHIASLPLHIDDRSALSLAQIRAAIKNEQRKRDVGIVVIDYLQLVSPPSGTPRDDRRVQVDAISRGLKNLAKDCNIPIVALTQLNRASEARADKTPTLSDLREAGGQEQDADVVILMHRDTTGRTQDPAQLKFILAKNRHGSQAVIELTFRGEHSRIEIPAFTPHDSLERNAS